MIKKLLYEEGFTIKGAVNFINKSKNDNGDHMGIKVNNKINHVISLLNEASRIIKKNLD